MGLKLTFYRKSSQRRKSEVPDLPCIVVGERKGSVAVHYHIIEDRTSRIACVEIAAAARTLYSAGEADHSRATGNAVSSYSNPLILASKSDWMEGW